MRSTFAHTRAPFRYAEGPHAADARRHRRDGAGRQRRAGVPIVPRRRRRGEAKRIHDELAKAIAAPPVREKLQGQGIDVSGASGSELEAFVRKEIARWAKVIKDNHIKSGD